MCIQLLFLKSVSMFNCSGEGISIYIIDKCNASGLLDDTPRDASHLAFSEDQVVGEILWA